MIIKRLHAGLQPAIKLIGAGVLLAASLGLADFSFAGVLWLAQILALAWFYSLVFPASAQASLSLPQIGRRTWLFASAWLIATIYWLAVAMHVYGEIALVLAVFFLALFVAGLACFYVLSLLLAAWLLRFTQSASWHILVFAACWLLAEWARGTWFTGFPWGAIGYAHSTGPFSVLAPYVGVYGLCFIAAGCSVACVFAWRRWRLASNSMLQRSWPAAALITFLLVLLLLPRPSFTQASGTLSVQIAQSNIPLSRDVQQRNRLSLQWLERTLNPGPYHANAQNPHAAALILTPEAAFPDLAEFLPTGWWARQQQRLAHRNQSAIIGAIWRYGKSNYSNAAFLMGAANGDRTAAAHSMASAPRYEKYHLVPFGEFVPPMLRWFVDALSIPMVDFIRGPAGGTLFDVQQQRLGLNICYEDVFGEELATRFVNPELAPTMWVNMSNLAWFATPGFITAVLSQHREIARMRTLEFERPTLRSTNTGATVYIDHLGQVQAELPYYREGNLYVTVQGRMGITPYAWWVSRWGLGPLVCVALTILCLSFILRQIKKSWNIRHV